MTTIEAVAFLKQVAAMSVKSGAKVKNNTTGTEADAGWGYVGLLNGHVVKLATNFNERHWNWSLSSHQLRDSQNSGGAITKGGCSLFKDKLIEAAQTLGLDEQQITNLKTSLNANKKYPDLVTRSVALAAVKTVARHSSENVNDKLINEIGQVVGNKKIDVSTGVAVKAQLRELNGKKNKFIDGLEELLLKLLPGEQLKSRRDAIFNRANQSIYYRNGKITLFSPDEAIPVQPELPQSDAGNDNSYDSILKRESERKDLLQQLRSIETTPDQKSDVQLRTCLGRLLQMWSTGREDHFLASKVKTDQLGDGVSPELKLQLARRYLETKLYEMQDAMEKFENQNGQNVGEFQGKINSLKDVLKELEFSLTTPEKALYDLLPSWDRNDLDDPNPDPEPIRFKTLVDKFNKMNTTMIEKGFVTLAREMSNVAIETKEPLPAPKGDAVRQTLFEIFKARAGVNPPKVYASEKEDVPGEKIYDDYHVWMMDEALKYTREKKKEPNLTLFDLTIEDVNAFIADNKEMTPQSCNAVIGKTDMTYQVTTAKIETVYGDDFEEVLNNWSNARAWTNSPVSYLNTRQKAGLYFTHEAEFQVGGTQVKSLVKPLRTEGIKNQLANFALTNLSVLKEEKQEILFQGLRFGSWSSSQNVEEQPFRFGQLVRQTILQNPKLLEEARNLEGGGGLTVPLYRIDMADEGSFSIPAETYTITVPNENGTQTRTINVKPEVHHFRIPTDNAKLCETQEGKKWALMTMEEHEQNLANFQKLTTQIDERLAPLVDNINKGFTTLINPHCDNKNHFVKLYQNCGPDMMRLGAKIALFAYRSGYLPSFNCNGGRDRTGLMDVECKTLALWLEGATDADDLKQKLDDYDANTPAVIELRKKVREESQNDVIAQEITLGGQQDKMLMTQMYGHAQNVMYDDRRKRRPDVPDLPEGMDDKTSTGLCNLYKVPSVP